MTMSLLISEGTVREALREVIDPELGVNVVDLGLIYGIAVDGQRVRVTMTLTTPGCPLHDTITEAVNEAVPFYIPGVESVDVNLVWDPPWSPEMMTEVGKQEIGWW
jgi:metal-sulfur cluster biosynthetic enzyme